MNRQFDIAGMSETQVRQHTTHLIVRHGVYVAEPHMQKFIDDGTEINGAAKHPFFQSTQKFEAMQHQTTAITRCAYPSSILPTDKLIWTKPLPSYHTGDLLLYRMAYEKDMAEWDEKRALRERHYRVRQDDKLTIQRAHDDGIIRTPDTRVIYWVTEDVGHSRRKVVYIGTIPIFATSLNTTNTNNSKYVNVNGKVVRKDRIYDEMFGDGEDDNG